MKHTVTLFTVLFLLASMLTGEKARSQGTNQSAEIKTDLFMSPNPSPYLSDWASHKETAQLTLTLSGAQSAQVRLAARVTLNGQEVASTNTEKMPMLSLHEGANIFTAADIIPLSAVSFSGNIDGASQRLGRLPAGQYEICVSAVLYPNVAGQSVPVCRPFGIQDIEPPVLVSPADGSIFGQNNVTANRTETVSSNEMISTSPRLSLATLAAMDSKSLADLRAFDLTAGNDHTLYYLDPKNTERDSAEAMQIPIQMNIGHTLRADSSIDNDDTEVVFEKIAARFVSTASSGNYPKGGTGYVFTQIIFQWLPPMPLPTTPIQYRLRIVPVLPGQDPNLALTSTPLGKDILLLGKLSADFTIGGISEIIVVNLVRTHKFAWAVQAQDVNGNPVGKNNGWSVPRTFDVGDRVPPSGVKLLDPDPDFDVLRESFFDVFEKVDSPKTKEPCPYTYKELVRSFVTPCKDRVRSLYEVWKIVTCTLRKAHGGEHAKSEKEVTIKKWTASCTPDSKVPEGATVEPEPPKDKVGDKKELDKIPSKEEADKKFNTGQNVNAGNTNITMGAQRCPYAYKVLKSKFFTPCVDGYKKLYYVYEIFRCLMPKGHAGPHEGTTETVYVTYGSVTCNDGDKTIPTQPEPPKDKVMKPEDIAKIPDKADADKPVVGVGKAPAPAPCPFVEKKLLRTVVGPWKKISTTVRHISWHGTTVAWADVVWQRDVFNVFSVSHCTLEKGHAGAHKMGPAKVEKEKYGSFTEKVTYGPGEPQVPPHPHATDSLPEE